VGRGERRKAVLLQVTFNSPEFLRAIPIALVVIVVAVLLARWYSRRLVGHFGKWELLREFSKLRRRRLRNAAYLTVMVALLLIALAEPVLPHQVERTEKAFNYIIVLDVSRSMDAEDYTNEVSRIGMARRCLFRLHEAFPKSVVGLVLFTNTTVSFEPTSDYGVTRFLLEYASIPQYASGSGSDVAAGLTAAVELIKEARATSGQSIKTIVLLSDGGDTIPADFREVYPRLRGMGIRVISVGLGGDEPVPIPNRDTETGEIIGYHYVAGHMATTKISEIPLITIAEATGGTYVRIWAEEDRLAEAVRLGNYVTDIGGTALGGEVEKAPITRWVLALFLLVFAVWCVDKRFSQG